MRPSEWVRERIESVARYNEVVWVDDPYRLLDSDEFATLRAHMNQSGKEACVVKNPLRLREFLDRLETTSATPRYAIIDQSYTLRDPHLLPKDAKPSDLLSLVAPDWKPVVPREARLRPTVRDFLVDITGFNGWPDEVNIYPYEKLARERPEDFVIAHDTFRSLGRALTSNDLIMVGASAVLQTNLFDLQDPLVALELAFHSASHWQEVARLFNAREREVINSRLCNLPAPLGELFGTEPDVPRAALVGLLLLKQHFSEAAGIQLAFVSPVFSKYRDYDSPEIGEVKAWFLEDEVPRFERYCSTDFLAHIREQLKLDNAENARAFGQRERFSGRLRSLVSFEIDRPTLVLGQARDPFRLEHLVPELSQQRLELSEIIRSCGKTIGDLRLKRAEKLDIKELIDLFDRAAFYRVDRMIGRIETLIRYIEGPAKRQWKSIPGFEHRWTAQAKTCRELLVEASRLRDELDFNFGRLLEERYSDIVPNKILTTNLFYEKHFADWRRDVDGSVRKAAVLVIDSMRLDIWREVIRPALEGDYEVEEALGFAVLPSETKYSRRAFFAGEPPSATSRGAETELLARMLTRVHGKPVEFEEMPARPSGMSFCVRSRDARHATYAGVFDFPDALSHEVDWDPHTLHEVQRPLVTEIRALLREIGEETLVFITADHGHVLQSRGAAVDISGADGVGYRAARVTQRIEGQAAARVFQIDARTLGHSEPGWFVFPRPGFALRDADDTRRRFRPMATYRHGGISMVEVVVPIACLRHRSEPTKVYLAATAKGKAVVGAALPIEIRIHADGKVVSPVFLTTDREGIDEITVQGLSTVPKTVVVNFLPTAPGRQRVTFTARLAGEQVGQTTIQLTVAATAVPEEDVAKAKLAKLFGDEA